MNSQNMNSKFSELEIIVYKVHAMLDSGSPILGFPPARVNKSMYPECTSLVNIFMPKICKFVKTLNIAMKEIYILKTTKGRGWGNVCILTF